MNVYLWVVWLHIVVGEKKRAKNGWKKCWFEIRLEKDANWWNCNFIRVSVENTDRKFFNVNTRSDYRSKTANVCSRWKNIKVEINRNPWYKFRERKLLSSLGSQLAPFPTWFWIRMILFAQNYDVRTFSCNFCLEKSKNISFLHILCRTHNNDESINYKVIINYKIVLTIYIYSNRSASNYVLKRLFLD